MALVGPNLFFDPSREELAVADAILAVSLTASESPSSNIARTDESKNSLSSFRILAVRTIDPPSRISTPGVADLRNPTIGAVQQQSASGEFTKQSPDKEEGVWKPPRGGMPRALIFKVMQMCVAPNGVAEEVFEGLKGSIKTP